MRDQRRRKKSRDMTNAVQRGPVPFGPIDAAAFACVPLGGPGRELCMLTESVLANRLCLPLNRASHLQAVQTPVASRRRHPWSPESLASLTVRARAQMLSPGSFQTASSLSIISHSPVLSLLPASTSQKNLPAARIRTRAALVRCSHPPGPRMCDLYSLPAGPREKVRDRDRDAYSYL